MSTWQFDTKGSGVSLNFTTGGITAGFGNHGIDGPNWFQLYSYDKSYFANGNYNFTLSPTKGLVGNIRLGPPGSTATAATTVTDFTTALRLATTGVTGTFIGNFADSNHWGRYVFNNICSVPRWLRIEMQIVRGIVIAVGFTGWEQFTGPNYASAIRQLTPSWPFTGFISTTEGVKLTDNTTHISVTAGVTASFIFRTVYDIYFTGLSHVALYLVEHVVYITDGIVTSITSTPRFTQYAI